jgi:hypothetical protein
MTVNQHLIKGIDQVPAKDHTDQESLQKVAKENGTGKKRSMNFTVTRKNLSQEALLIQSHEQEEQVSIKQLN